jgi:primase-polymerase (primpol)-like protein
LNVKETTTPGQLERFWKIVQAFDSYTERSRSGKGLHIWIRGKVGMGCRRDGVEVYSQQRFIICTGDAVLNKPVEHRQELLDILVSEIRAAAQTNHVELVEQDETESDEEVGRKAHEAGDIYGEGIQRRRG